MRSIFPLLDKLHQRQQDIIRLSGNVSDRAGEMAQQMFLPGTVNSDLLAVMAAIVTAMQEE